MDNRQNNRPDDFDRDPDPQFDNNRNNDSEERPPRQGVSFFVVLLILAVLFFIMSSGWSGSKEGEIPYGMFIDELQNDNIAKVEMVGSRITGEFKVEPYNPEYIEYCKSKGLPLPSDAIKPVQKPSEAKSEPTPAEVKPAQSDSGEAAPASASSAETPVPVESNDKDSKPEQAEKTSANSKTDKDSKPAKDSKTVVSAKPEETKSNDVSKNESDKKITRGFFLGKPAERLSKKFFCIVPVLSLQDNSVNQLLTEKLGENYAASEPADYSNYLAVLYIVITVGIFIFILVMMRRSREQMGGGFMSGFSRSPAKKFEPSQGRTTFRDVAGLDGVKTELEEIVEYLKNPEKFARLGARIPKGVLLNGPPGTGKTLLARAVAGEADVPFFSINGSEFIQMFVGVGASRVRDLFGSAKEQAPAIIFIDEIDAVGRLRGTGVGGGHDEREQTLNQILSEMDGFAPTESVIVMAATNRPDVLDPALLRPGRFDRHITVDRPTSKGRLEMFKVHTRHVPLASDVDFQRLAAATIGLTGADIRNIVNEAALWATRQNKNAVDMSDFEYAKDKVIMGAKREEVLTEKERRMTAYHEAGHALLAWMTPGSERVNKVTIVPRGFALGVTQLVPDEDRLSVSESQLRDRLAFIMGGRAAEKVVFGEVTAGAENDIKQSTSLARKMVVNWGMSKRLGPAAFKVSEEHPFLGKEISAGSRDFSEYTAQIIDEEVMQILREADTRAEETLMNHRNKLDALAEALLLKEELTESEIEAILGAPAYKKEADSNSDDSESADSQS
ncbi:MAG: ATP-dependent zinc metalloprotease FtsH [Thermoguttaceae bacterium]|nr:ATP-dependent zinc metalloprotease FtsH [Thermoguttaceae bacterium]